ncbi:MAG TPA: hypothetical protein PKC29_07210 [Thermodesulfobacteriota bacterium]|nr:hypothetical protein [Thermodesulfobacteriota bacterium]
MAKSMLIVYESVDRFGRMSEYWKRYINFYEEYWGGPTSPYGVWFGNEYNDFRERLSCALRVPDEEVRDCLFMKSKDGGYLISPLRSFKNAYMLDSDNCIPPPWFILFDDSEREFFYTHMGFGRVHYGTALGKGLGRIDEADRIIEESFKKYGGEENAHSLFMKLKKIQSGLFELRTWLSEFDEAGYLVLDYGELCSFLSPYTLNGDRSSKEIWDVLSNLEKNDMEQCRLVLGLFLQKWQTIKQKVSEDITARGAQ